MRKISYLLFILVLSSSCHRNAAFQEITFENTLKIKEKCPEFGDCKLVVLKNNALDTLHINNSLTYRLKESALTDVVKYTYNIHFDRADYDGGYKEEVLFEIPKGNLKKTYVNNDLQKTKMIFGRHCFCRGKTGLFKIKDGTLRIRVKNEKVAFDLEFFQDDVPRVIKKISTE